MRVRVPVFLNRLVACFALGAWAGTSVLLVDHAWAGAWTAPQGTAYQKFAFNYFKTNKNFNASGDLVAFEADGVTPLPKFKDINFTYYAEYGLTDTLTLFGSLPYKDIESSPSTGPAVSNSGIGDIDLGVRYNLYNAERGVFSIQGLVKVPEAYDRNDPLPLGNGQYDFELRLLYGNGRLYPFYYGLEFGYRWRFKEPSDEWKYLLEAGYTINPKFYVRAKLDGTLSAKNADVVTDPSGNPVLTTQFDLAKAEFTVGYVINKRFSLEAMWSPTVYGKTTAFGDTFQLAIIYSTSAK